MAPKTRSADSPPLAHADPISKHSSLAPTNDTLALVIEQMAHVNARMGAHTVDVPTVVVAVGAAAADTLLVQRRRDAQREPPRDDLSIDNLPPPPPYPHLGYPSLTH
jgi:hypothetical protein